jgi:hypothetical protein
MIDSWGLFQNIAPNEMVLEVISSFDCYIG